MKKIELFERAIAEQTESLKANGINRTMFWAYRKSLEAGNELINFNDVIWDEDIEEIVKCMDENNIDEFTISSTFSSLLSTIASFEKYGFKIAEMTEVKSPYTDFRTGEKEIVPAIKLKKD